MRQSRRNRGRDNRGGEEREGIGAGMERLCGGENGVTVLVIHFGKKGNTVSETRPIRNTRRNNKTTHIIKAEEKREKNRGGVIRLLHDTDR